MITYTGLIQLGFTSKVDFLLEDKGDGVVYIAEWLSDQPQPSEAEIETAHNEWQTAYDAKAYQRTRAAAYEEVKEQLDLLYHDMAADKGDKTGEWFKAVKKVKDDNPKP
jgi:hypothetical protein